jgi:hypothetical protein
MLKAPDIVAVLLEFGADPNELDWEGPSPLKDALDAALRRLHWHMDKRERELQKFADICSRLVRAARAVARRSLNFPTESRLARPVKKKKNLVGPWTSRITNPAYFP